LQPQSHLATFYTTDARERYLGLLRDDSVDVVGAIREGLLVLFDEGSSSRKEQVAKIDQFLTKASRRRSGPIRILAEGLANYQTVGSSAEHLAVEHQLGALFKRFPVVPICAYDVRAFEAVTIVEALKLHSDIFGSRVGYWLN